MKRFKTAATLLLVLLCLPIPARADVLLPGQKPPRNEESEAFVALYADDITGWDSAYDGIVDAEKIVLWSYPCSGEIRDHVEGWYAGDSAPEPRDVFETCYRDGEGRFWGYIRYIYGSNLSWVCLTDPGSEDIPADAAIVEAVEHRVKTTAFWETSPVVVLVLALAAGTGVILFWHRKKNAK